MARRVVRSSRADPCGLPQWIRPQLTELVDAAPHSPEWLNEIKFDGYRMHARLDRGAVRLLTRTGIDRSSRFGSPLVLSRLHWVRPELVAEVKFLAWTQDNLLRQVVYEGLREDKLAAEVRRPVPKQMNEAPGPL